MHLNFEYGTIIYRRPHSLQTYLRRSSPGPRELGTMTLTAALPLAQLIFCTTWECPWAEKPRPPGHESNRWIAVKNVGAIGSHRSRWCEI